MFVALSPQLRNSKKKYISLAIRGQLNYTYLHLFDTV